MASILDELNKLKNEFGADKGFFNAVITSLTNLNDEATKVNKSLFLNRERIIEITQVLGDASPEIARLGGDLKDVTRAISESAESARRSVIFASEDITGLFVSSKLLGVEVRDLSRKFGDIGLQMSNVAKTVEQSINYVQSIGGNAGLVMNDVLSSMELMNRFNFQDGVMGFTRMAAQASFMKVNMGDVKSLADKVMDPSGAIEVASALQRLGVAAGSLVDPFSLMYKSINDPEGLQDSIIELSKNFVDFNSETGKFSINPAGIMQIKELSSVLDMRYEDFTKMALAASDFDKRLSEISFDYKGNKEDLLLLSNMAQFRGGEYVVKIDEKEKRLRDVTEQEFMELKKIQEESPKTLEDIARGQMSLTETIASDVRAIAYKLVYGVTSAEEMQKMAEGIRNVQSIIGTKLYETMPTTKELRTTTDEGVKIVKDTVKGIFDSFSGDMSEQQLLDLENRYNTFLDNTNKLFINTLERGQKNVTEGYKDIGAIFRGENPKIETKMPYGDKTKTIEKSIKETMIGGNYDLNFNGEIKHKVDVPIGVDSKTVESIINKTMGSSEFKNKIFEIMDSYSDGRYLPKK